LNSHNRKKASQKITLIGAIADFLLSVFKVVAGVLGNSGALIADGVHSFSDLLSDAVVLYEI
jgi:divalent metal cation (Fe/Co/Zn/Cd) transporter